LIDSPICIDLNKQISTYLFDAFDFPLDSEVVFCSFCLSFDAVSCLLQHLNKAEKSVPEEKDESSLGDPVNYRFYTMINFADK
jgi:hypothetical protein